MSRVLAMPLLDPGAGRIDLELPEGLSVAEIVQMALPTYAALHPRMRVALVSNDSQVELMPGVDWRRVRPRAGVTVMIRVLPGDNDLLRSALMIAVSVAATAFGQMWAPALAGALGIPAAWTGAVAGAITAGLTLAGGLLINALIPAAGSDSEKPNYLISGFRNAAAPDGVVPSIMGRHRFAPYYVGQPYIEIVDGQQFIRGLFIWSLGRTQITDLKLGETPLEQFKDVMVEHRYGLPSDLPVTLYQHQVLQEDLSVELRRDLPRNDVGEVVPGPAELVPTVRRSASDTDRVTLIFAFPGGLGHFEGSRLKTLSVAIRLRYRKVGTEAWSAGQTITFTNKKREGFFASHTLQLPERSGWDIELARTTEERTGSAMADRITWMMLQSFRPEYPLNFDVPVTLTSIRVRSTYQLNGQLDNLNGIVERVCPDFDAATGQWVTRATANPASLFRYALQGPENAFPAPDSELDIALLEDWHALCVAKGLTYNRVHDFEASRWQVLSMIASAGRAKPTELAGKWSVVIDRPQSMVVEHITPRNAHDISWRRTYFTPPDAFVVDFLDETSDYAARQRIVRWPGYAGPISITEKIRVEGQTNPASVYLAARRRQYELIHRPDRFRITQNGLLRSTTRGDLVKGGRLVWEEGQSDGRVLAVRGNHVSLDSVITMEEGQSYAARFFIEETIGGETGLTSVVRSIQTIAGDQTAIVFVGDGAVPQGDDIILVGKAGWEATDLIVSEVESGQGATTILSLVAAAPQIDALIDAEEVPAWDGRVGEIPDPDLSVPAVPRVLGVETYYELDVPAGLTVLLAPGVGSAALVATFELLHRLEGAGAWSGPVPVKAGGGGLVVSGYGAASKVELQARAVSSNGVPGPYTSVLHYEVDAPQPPVPAPIVSATTMGETGEATLSWTTPADALVANVNVYRGASADFSAAVLIDTVSSAPLMSQTFTDTVAAGVYHYFLTTLSAAPRESLPLYCGVVTVS